MAACDGISGVTCRPMPATRSSQAVTWCDVVSSDTLSSSSSSSSLLMLPLLDALLPLAITLPGPEDAVDVVLPPSAPLPLGPVNLATLFSFFHFILLFWNQILICRSVRASAWAISIRRLLVRYRLKWNSFSSSRV